MAQFLKRVLNWVGLVNILDQLEIVSENLSAGRKVDKIVDIRVVFGNSP